jgi:hypothetical protein
VGRQSKIALAWLEQQQKLREFFEDSSMQIRHAYNSYKEVIAEDGNTVDGYVEYKGILFLFQSYGCYWHGCSQCNVQSVEHPHFHAPHSRVLEGTLAKKQNLCNAYVRSGRKWQLHTAWEHEYEPALAFQGYDLHMMTDIMGDRETLCERVSAPDPCGSR